MSSAHWMGILLVAGFCVPSLAAQKDDDKPKSPVDIVAKSPDRTSVSGTFRLDRQRLHDGKPLPKQIGMLTEKRGRYYFVIVEDKGLAEVLTSSDGKDLTLCGKVARIEDSGVFIMVDSKITRPTVPTSRRKRGGL